jgi:crotonobetainyl-CoA:carnitine CoA-transferase CaiB-like acyl-CoA transferase
MPRAGALDLLQRYEVWAEPWNRGQEQTWLQDPTLNKAGSVYRTEYPDIGVVGMIGTLVHFSRSTARGRGYAPAAGEHTRQILAELGYDEATIAELYADKVVA